MHFLEFEKPIAEIEGKIAELRHMSDADGLNIADEVTRLQGKVDKDLKINLCQAHTVAKDAGCAPSRPSSLPGLYRRLNHGLPAFSRR